MTEPDRIEVSRTAHELAERHGWNAHSYAARLAAAALAEGKVKEHEFWKRVEAALTPRGSTEQKSTESGPTLDASGTLSKKAE
jgi:hypothetical protein